MQNLTSSLIAFVLMGAPSVVWPRGSEGTALDITSRVDQPSCDTGLRAYQQNLWPIQRKNCVACHDDNGLAIAHSSADPATAYAITKNLVNFEDVNSSLIIQKLNQKHWLQYGGSPIDLQTTDVVTAITAWWNGGENSCPKKNDYVSQSQIIPADLPTRSSGQYVTLTFDLGANEPKLKNCTLLVDIQLFEVAGDKYPASYRLRNPRASCTDQPLKVANLWFPVSGEIEGYENVYASIDQIIPPSSQPVLLSPQESILIQRKTTGDTLSVSFDPFGAP